jgi:iron-sulfur cluster assembly protein
MITITEQAAKKISANLEKRGKGIGIQVGVRTTGCSGMAYVLEYIDTAPVTRDWFKYKSNDATIYVNGKDLVYMNGMEIDYVRNGLNEGFEFRNPNERDRCGCGESFRV